MQRRISRAVEAATDDIELPADARARRERNEDDDDAPRPRRVPPRRPQADGDEDMPDEAFVATMRELLTRRREALLETVRDGRAQEKREPLAEMVGGVPDAGDESVAVERADLRNARIGRDVTELRDIEAALERIAQGEYGYCIDCGGEIGEARLRAQPTAARDVRCQSLFEQLYIGPGAPPSL